MPNFTGVMAMPRLPCGCAAFHLVFSARRVSSSADLFSSCQIV